jgi:hypothetical protein
MFLGTKGIIRSDPATRAEGPAGTGDNGDMKQAAWQDSRADGDVKHNAQRCEWSMDDDYSR